MDWPKLPWAKTEPEFGDLFEEQLEKAVEIESNLIFSGVATDAHRTVEFEMPTEDNHQVFVIERKVRGDERRDQHLFIVKPSMMSETQVDWYYWKPEFTNGKPLFIMRLDNEKGRNELTRILDKHWDFSRHL